MSPESNFISVKKGKDEVTVKINTEVFPIDLIYTASYHMLDRAYVILDGSPSEVVYAILKPRSFEGPLDELGREFYDQLISCAFGAVQVVRNEGMREALFNAIWSGAPGLVEEEVTPSAPELPEDIPDDEDFDEEDIATLWEEKFGSKGERDGEEA